MQNQSDREPGVFVHDGQKERIPGQRHDLNKCTLHRRATREAAAILTDLHRPAPKDIDLPSLTDKVAGDLIYIRERLERSAITKAEELVSELTGSASAGPFILHADFSLRNMLNAGARGFVAIDPWGAVGERAFDVATWAAEHPPTLIEERASALADSLGLKEDPFSLGPAYSLCSAPPKP